jgi:hypothetical protein
VVCAWAAAGSSAVAAMTASVSRSRRVLIPRLVP